MADNPAKPEVTVESLQAQLDTALAQLETEKAEHFATKENLANALGGLAEREEALKAASEVIDGQKQTITDQEAQIVAQQASPAEFPTITVDKKSYEVRVKSFQYKKVKYTLEQLLASKSLQKELVTKKVGFIVEKEA